MKFLFFFFNDTATTEIYTLSLHDALPISCPKNSGRSRRSFGPFTNGTPNDAARADSFAWQRPGRYTTSHGGSLDRKSTRLNSSHLVISYAGFCLEKKKKDDGGRIVYDEAR